MNRHRAQARFFKRRLHSLIVLNPRCIETCAPRDGSCAGRLGEASKRRARSRGAPHDELASTLAKRRIERPDRSTVKCRPARRQGQALFQAAIDDENRQYFARGCRTR
jgi:hypothetical protein